jgi:hypothetical protein
MACGQLTINNEPKMRLWTNAAASKFIRNNSVKEFVDNVYSGLSKNAEFTLNTTAEYTLLRDKIEEFIKANGRLSADQKQDILDSFASYLAPMFNLSPTEVINISESPGQIVETKELTEQPENSELKVSTVDLDDFYGEAFSVKAYMIDQFQRDLLSHSLINFTTGKRIKNTSDLNLEISLMKQDLFSSLVDYLNTSGNVTHLNVMYNNGVFDGKNYNNVMNKAFETFSKLDRSQLASAFNNIHKVDINGIRSNKQLVDAFNAYATLINFDSILKKSFGKLLSITPQYIGIETDASSNKYKLSVVGNLVNTWRTNENVDAMKELGHVSRLLIEQTPLIDRYSKVPLEGKYLNMGLFLGVTNKLRDESIISRINPNSETYRNFIRFHDAPSYYLNKILLDALNGRLRDVIDFTRTDLNVIASIYERFYRPKSQSTENYSLYDIMKSDISSSEAMTEFDILECIAGIVDRSCGTKYTQYYRDADGNIQTKEITTVNTDRAQIQKQNNINIYNKFRGDKRTVLDKYNIKEEGDYIVATVNGKRLELKVTGSGRGISNSIHELLRGFDVDFNKLKDYYELGKNVTFTDTELTYNALVEFIDDFLNTKFLQGNIDVLNIYADNELVAIDEKKIPLRSKHLDKLLSSSLIAANAMRVMEDFNQSGEKDVETYAINNSNYYKNRLSSNKRGYIDKGIILTVNPESNNNLERLIRAEQILSGDLYKTTVKNNAGDNIPTNGISNLASYFTHYVNYETENPDSAFASNIFAGSNISALDGVSVKTDGENRNGVKKTASNFTVAELSYTSILFDYFGNRFNTQAGKAKVKIQPTTYSDKSRQYLFGINIDKLKNKEGVSFKNMTIDQVKQFKRESAKGFYKKIFDNVMSDYANTYEFGYETYLNYLRDGRDGVPANPAAYERIKDKIDRRLENLKTKNANVQDDMDLDFSNPLDRLNIQDFTDLLSVTKYWEYNEMAYEAGVPNVENLHVSKNKTNSFLKPNNSLVYKATKLYDSETLYNNRQLRESKKFLRDLISSNIRFWTRYSDGSNNVELLNVLNHFGIYANNSEEPWVDHNTNELILAKDSKGEPIDREYLISNSNILDNDEDFELNPMLEQYFYEYSTLAENLRLLLTGAESGHPFKKDDTYSITDASYKAFEKEEAVRANAQLKRNVIIPATLQHFMQKSILGIPSEYRLAVMADFPAKVFNFKGESAEVDSMDGSALVNPFIAVLENLSLQDSAVGMDKKTIGHDINSRYGVANLLKFATFAMYNERIRSSNLSDIELRGLFKKMCLDWKEDIDLTKNIFGNQMSLNSNANGNRLFYKSGALHKEVLGFTKLDAPNTYEWSIVTVDSSGERTGEVETFTAPVNNLFKLWELLGGEYSESLNSDGYLEYSDASIETVANYINNVGEYRGGEDDYPTQSNTYQPLKNTMIAYLLNKSAIKVGAENINKADAWIDSTDNPLKFFTINTKGLGVQMDADHHADEAEMTEFTQVLSSIEANGWTHDIAKLTYEDLGKATLSLIKDKSEAAKLYLATNQKSDMYEAIGKELIRGIREDDNKIGLSKSIIDIIRKEFREFRSSHDEDEYKIPFSDSNLQAISLSTFTSGINSKAIKKKHPGIGAVMVPGFNIIQNININGETYSYDDIYDMAAARNMTPKEYLQSIQAEIEAQGPLTIDKLNPGDRVKVIDPTGNTIEYNIDDMKMYNFVKSNFKEFYPDVTKGNNLKPAQIYWNVGDTQYNIFDMPAVQDAINLRSQGKPSKRDDLILQQRIQKVFKWLDSGYMPLTASLKAEYDLDPSAFTERTGALLIDGEVVVPIQNLQNKPAELVLTKLYASKFNLNNNDSIAKIKQQGVGYFVGKYNKYHLPQTLNYDLMFTKGNGNHTYIVFDTEGLDNIYKVENDDNTVKIGNIVYKTDSQGNRLYKIRDGETTFVNEYRMIQGGNEVRLLHVSDPSYINEIYHSNDYDSVKVRESSEIIDGFISLNGKNRYLSSLKGLDADAVDKINNSQALEIARKQYSSFLKSLEFTASRIPAQTLQSFMKMEVKQFSSSDKNIAYVSHWQTWLQGSDYKQKLNLKLSKCINKYCSR